MRVALLCDVDQTVYHVGDEAIATSTTRRLEARGLQVTRVSRHEKYGPGGRAAARTLPALTFPWPLEQRAAYLGEIRRVLAGEPGALPAEDKLHAILERLREVDALVIGGGGSLTSRYGWLLDERIATAEAARSLGKRVVLSGQSLGPELTDADRAAVRSLLDSCDLVGLRDALSVRIARQIAPDHPAIVQVLDDAHGLGLPENGTAPELDERLLSVTLGGDGDPFPREQYAGIAAALIDAVVVRTGARVQMVPHMADPDSGGGDLDLHREVAARVAAEVELLPIELDTASAARTSAAGWVLSTRFHPVVFGAAAGAAVLAVPLNRYGATRMDGALRAHGLAGGAVPLAALWDPISGGPSALVDEVADALVAARPAEREHLRARAGGLRSAGESWWDGVVDVLSGARTASEVAAAVEPGPAPRQRWPEPLRRALAPYSTAVEAAPAPSAAIILRTRDRLRLLDRAIQDVLAQTRQDWELVVVDDAGDAAAVDAVLARHEGEAAGRIRVRHRAASTGMEAASNEGLRASTAPHIAVHDDDDTWHATFLQETLAHLGAHPEQEAVVVRTLIVHEHETATGFVEDEVFPSWPEIAGVRLVDYLAVNRNVPIAMLHRRRVHEAIGEYDESLPVVGDYAFHLALLQHAEVGFLDRPLAQWRHRRQAAGASSNSMYALSDGHRHYDAVLRERALREWTRENGIGLPLFLARNTESTVERSEERILEELRALREEVAELRARRSPLEELGRRAYRRVRRGR
ncbi:polysaccharide pyruvyl transferase family protein [Brachybacterium sp. J144]|uniref:polysaccharide pyruvyl transferase family protein n=1 Tax=Brachybacterium sp. J144 TaxID=3116487 RepID=UPI002E7762B5|nr:polysaccharide pyruvyl transferase family protein [Brachybacterium sp. J144]MEE1651947.1 polysaccharide pyruvyl transferase family protein [Brachybacterium sp. J144]